MNRGPVYCAPGVKSNNGVCLDNKGLKYYVNLYNNENSNKNKIRNYMQMSDQELIDEINKKLKNVCNKNDDWCWVDQPFASSDRNIQNYYKPRIPAERYKWLTTTDIDNVIRQYEKLFPNFKFLGTVPLDFDKFNNYRLSSNDYCINYRQLGITKLGAVFNLDTHEKRGSHWVSLFCNLDKNYIAFFDSTGVEQPPKEIRHLMDVIREKIESCNPSQYDHLKKYIINKPSQSLKIKINNVKKQRGGSECGVFCIYFILKCLLGDDPDNIFQDANVNDENINKFRSKIFRPGIGCDNNLFKHGNHVLDIHLNYLIDPRKNI